MASVPDTPIQITVMSGAADSEIRAIEYIGAIVDDLRDDVGGKAGSRILKYCLEKHNEEWGIE